jgi:hypothetical protein
MILSIDAEKALDKSSTLSWIKALRKLEIIGMFLNTIKVIYDKLRASIMLNGEQLKLVPLKSRMRRSKMARETELQTS